ncbi:RsmB/NOP family class I SAM-dependent RNA methyltransferase [Roseitranquillus sediminis]|uniref:RsmB/NOP family class I SAM-dependent RNA methyltransferase n=1 Tax=Roseitranquillus sediminis TaxID=2809051 RepID=UPI001D0BFCBF|nr:RsmB/NOP family class I SAM-dependent RNA methyltransferase [Roseitranquillus sediminis]MBM9593675.1 RsmB/NOP family class I SAM-dependent RNA methyltransferase [Roseitranquillus sediminis]
MQRRRPEDDVEQEARRAALRLIGAVTMERRLLSDALPRETAALAPAERARAQRLATETLRWADRADRMLGPHLRRRPPQQALDALRLGTWEICGDGAAPHGVVDALVGLMGQDRQTRNQAGMVNAILRRLAEAGHEAWDTLPVPRLPRPLRKRLLAAWGRPAAEAMEAAHAAGAPLDVTPKDVDAATLAARLGGVVLPTGSVRLARGGQVSALPGYAEGDWWVQDAAAALPVRLADPQPGERALDLCAAPGGKTLQLAAAGAEVTALDLSAARMRRLEDNLARCGLRAETVVADALDWNGGGFDLVLLDAPCSATGTIRRHPDLPHAKALGDMEPLLELQRALIDRAVAALRPGGRLVFCTCSILPEEGEAQVHSAHARHPRLRTVRPEAEWIEEGWVDKQGGLRLRPDYWPERGGMDGFYIAVLRG